MTSQPHWSALDDETADLLSLVADPFGPVGRDVVDQFLEACWWDASYHDGWVSVNRVSAFLADADIEPRRYSSLWAAFTGKGKPMRKAEPHEGDVWETRHGSASRNNGKPMRLRRWVG